MFVLIDISENGLEINEITFRPKASFICSSWEVLKIIRVKGHFCSSIFLTSMPVIPFISISKKTNVSDGHISEERSSSPESN